MGAKRKTHEQYVEEVAKINKKIAVIETYVNWETHILHKCLVEECGYEWRVTPNNILQGGGCPKCNNNNKKLTHEEYEKRVRDVNENILIMETYMGNNTPILHRCLKEGCGHEWYARPSGIMNGGGCPVCSGHIIGNPPLYKNSIWSQPVYKSFFEEYLTEEQMKTHTPKSNHKVEATCPICKRRKEIYLNHLWDSGLGCVCNDNKSYPEKFLYNLFEQVGIEFNIQYCPLWAEKKKYDFYIDSIDCIVETHGGQHYRGWNHSDSDVLRQQKNDDYKRDMALKNNIRYYIEINCMKSDVNFIKKNIVDSGLLDLLNINEDDIDWNKCNEFASHSLVSTVADLWNAGFSIKKIKAKTKLSDSTIVKYLKIAAEIELCDYSQEESKRRSIIKEGERPNATPVYCLELNKVFSTVKQTGHTHVSSCCNGKRKTADKKHWYYLHDKTLKDGAVINGAITLGLITEEEALRQLNDVENMN